MTAYFISIGELSKLTHLSTHTLRFYESIGVLQPAIRATNNHRRYHQSDVTWLEFVIRLKNTGMPLVQITEYARLRAQGDSTLQQRMTMLQMHQKYLATKINELQQYAQVLDNKVSFYHDAIAQLEPTHQKADKNEHFDT